jgi:hypothetical protein
MNTTQLRWGIVVAGVLASVTQGCRCEDAQANAIKTVMLQGRIVNESNGFEAAEGSCLVAPDVPKSPYDVDPNHMRVGHDFYYRSGGLGDCAEYRSRVFLAAIRFDELSQFDTIVFAELSGDVLLSTSRSGINSTNQTPPVSFATNLGMAVDDWSKGLPFDADVSLVAGSLGPLKENVTQQVKMWTDKSRPNFGFVLSDATPLPELKDPPERNDGKVSWYGNIRLRVDYIPSKNPRAPQ